MREALEEMHDSLNEDNMDLLSKAAGGAMQTLKMKDGKLQLDSFTASAIKKVYDKVNPANQKKMSDMINNGTKSSIMKLQDFVMKQIKSSYNEEADLDEGTWATPDTPKEKAALKKLLSKPLKAKDAEDKLYDLVGDDEMYDDLGDYADKNPNDDVRAMVKSHMKRLGIKEEADLDEKSRQLKDPKKEVMVVKKGEVIVIDKKDQDNYMKKGWKLAEGNDLDEASVNIESLPFKSLMDVVNDMMKQLPKSDKKNYEKEVAKVLKTMGVKSEEADLDEASKEGTIKIIKTKDGKFQIQKMTKGKFVDIGKPYNSQKEAEKFRSGQPDLFGEEVELDEFTVSDVEIAMKKKYGKVDKEAIEKLKKVQHMGNVDRNALVKVGHGKLHVESVDLDEADDFKPHMMYDPKTGKGYKADTMDDHLRMKKMGYTHDAPKKEEVDLDEASARSDAMKAMRKGKSVDPADIDNTATDDDVKGASKNIIMQLRKSISLRGNFSVEFGDGKKVKIPAAVAQAITQKHNLLKKPADKEKFQAQITKSYKDMLKILKAGYGEQKESILERMNRKIKENKNG